MTEAYVSHTYGCVTKTNSKSQSFCVQGFEGLNQKPLQSEQTEILATHFEIPNEKININFSRRATAGYIGSLTYLLYMDRFMLTINKCIY